MLCPVKPAACIDWREQSLGSQQRGVFVQPASECDSDFSRSHLSQDRLRIQIVPLLPLPYPSLVVGKRALAQGLSGKGVIKVLLVKQKDVSSLIVPWEIREGKIDNVLPLY